MHWNLRLKFHSKFFKLVKIDITLLISLHLCQFASTFTNLTRFETSKGNKIYRIFEGFIRGWSIMNACSSSESQFKSVYTLSCALPLLLNSRANWISKSYITCPKLPEWIKPSTVLAVNCELLTCYIKLTDTEHLNRRLYMIHI